MQVLRHSLIIRVYVTRFALYFEFIMAGLTDLHAKISDLKLQIKRLEEDKKIVEIENEDLRAKIEKFRPFRGVFEEVFDSK